MTQTQGRDPLTHPLKSGEVLLLAVRMFCQTFRGPSQNSLQLCLTQSNSQRLT
jgi:hypothetical protein